MTTRDPLPLTCPHCGRVNDFHDGPTPDAVPEPGDVALCWLCWRPAFYVATPFGLALRAPTDEELEQLEASAELRAARGVVAESFTPTEASRLRWRS